MKTVYLSLGSNVGDREAHLAAARSLLQESGVHVLRASSVYETEPQGMPDQAWYLNQVVEAQTSLFPRQLLSRVKKIERMLGRKRGPRNGPRVIDLDILLYGEVVVQTDGLEIPHPRMGERRFVLEPLVEIAPSLRHPVSRVPMVQLLKKTQGQKVNKGPQGGAPFI